MKCREGRNLLYVALTRARSKRLINISREQEDPGSVRYSNAFVGHKVKGCKEQDNARHWNNDLTVSNVQELVDKESNVCYLCRRGLYRDNFTLDRVNSELPHNIDNCRLCCYSCNHKKNNYILAPDNIQ